MKKTMALVLGLALVISMAGCGKAAAETNSNLSGTKETAANEGAQGDDYFTWDGDIITGLTDAGKEQTELVIPDTAKSIGLMAFLGDTTLTSVALGTGLEELGEGAFYMCENLAEISFPASLKKIGPSAFYKCESLVKVTFSDALVEIGENAFGMCKILETIELPEGLTSLGEKAFYPCTHLNSVYLPVSLENIPAGVFGLKKTAVLYVKEGSWADLHFSEFVEADYITEDPMYIKNYY